jgi:Flp pilus assembly protein TadG
MSLLLVTRGQRARLCTPWCGCGWVRRTGAPEADRGSMALELALVTVVIIVLLMSVVAMGRVTYGEQLVQNAAAAAGRDASLAGSGEQAWKAAAAAAHTSLADAGLSCTGEQVEVSGQLQAGGEVDVTVRCSADLSRLGLSGLPGRMQLHATSHTPIDPLRQFAAS